MLQVSKSIHNFKSQKVKNSNSNNLFCSKMTPIKDINHIMLVYQIIITDAKIKIIFNYCRYCWPATTAVKNVGEYSKVKCSGGVKWKILKLLS